MSAIIPVKEGQFPVDARDLHNFLEVGKDFTTWIKDRIRQYGFLEGADYQVFPEIGENLSGGRPAMIYEITLSMAKELSMVERNDRGKQARQYFIECERRLKEGIQPLSQLQILQQAIGVLTEHEARTKALEEDMGKVQSLLNDTHQQTHYLEARLKDTQRGMVDIDTPLRTQLNKAVRDYALRTDGDYRAAYNKLFDIIEAQEHINIRLRADHRGVRPIDVLEEGDLLVRAIRIAKAL